jgi:hypothetical protein
MDGNAVLNLHSLPNDMACLKSLNHSLARKSLGLPVSGEVVTEERRGQKVESS